MDNQIIESEKLKIKSLIHDLSIVLNVNIKKLDFLEEKINKILFYTPNNNLTTILNNYQSLLEEDMISIFRKKITPSIQFGINNDFFTFIGYAGKHSITSPIEVNENTYYSFDSISKILTSIIVMLMTSDGMLTLDSTVNSYNKDFNMDASIRDILNFTAMIQTEKRIDNLSVNETIEILKKCKENIVEKEKFKNYYQYNDIGYMILRLSIKDFLERLEYLIDSIDNKNLTYKNIENKELITGGKIGLEYFTPDTKGRNIPFPGHTGLYGNMEGLLNLFKKTLYTSQIISPELLNILLTQPYTNPLIYDKNGHKLYTSKIAGIYRKPNNIVDEDFDKMRSCDFSNLTTNKAIASAGTCGSWVMGDNLSNNNKFGTYVGGILTNPYSYINIGEYPNKENNIPNTNLKVTPKGVIIGYPAMLNEYKEIITKYGLLLELLTEYLKTTDYNYILNNKYKLTKRLQKTI